MKYRLNPQITQIIALLGACYFLFGVAGAQQTETESLERAIIEEAPLTGNITLDFKDADIRDVLKIISHKSGVNIVCTPEVIGTVTIRLVDVRWEKALDVILRTYGFAYEKVGDIIIVAPIERLTEQKKREFELAEVQSPVTEIFNLKFIDAADAKKSLEPLLSPRGRITVLETTGQAGWEFGVGELGKRKRAAEGRISRSKTLIVSDILPVIERIKELLRKIDLQPQQILIEARIMEANRDKLRDFGLDWATGGEGVSSSLGHVPINKKEGKAIGTLGAQILGPQPSVFTPKAPITPTTAGLRLIYRKLTGTQFETILHILEEKVKANTLSAPRILTLNNQEASILVGTKFPFLKSIISAEGRFVGQEFDRYQDIGIQFNVVPQVAGEDSINLIIHPAITSYTETVKARSADGETLAEYPIIITREAETQILMKDGETVVIGGLLKDVKSKGVIGIPILKDIPILGLLFQRKTIDIGKIDLLIFITARVAKEGEFSPEEIKRLEERLED